MSETGPTGTNEPVVDAESTGPTGTNEPVVDEQTGPTGPTFATAETTVVAAPQITTMDELLSSRAAVLAQETNDRAILFPLLNPTRESYRPQLFAWAAAGFPAIYVVQSFSFTPPNVCSDGVTRDVVAYAWYLLGTDIGQVIAKIQSLLTGITVSYSFDGNVLRIHVSRA